MKEDRAADVNDLAGSWSDDEANAFAAELEAQRGIDEELWR